MARSPEEKERRKARYDLAKRLGYSVEEARRYRDHSGERIRETVQTTRVRMERTSILERDAEFTQRLRTLRQWQREQTTDLGSRAEITADEAREDDWRAWSSSAVGFPPDILNQIVQNNLDAGEPDFSSFGFRVAYAEYVLELSESEALDFADYVEDNMAG